MIPKRLFVVSQLVVALLFSLLLPDGALAQESESGQAEEGSKSDRKPGITVIVDAAGAVQIIDKPGTDPRPAKKGDQVPVEGTVLTGPGAQANLALSNGAFFQVLENSSFSITKFEQAPFEFVFSNGASIQKKEAEEFGADEAVVKALDASEEAWNDLPSEPTESNANFALNYGTMIGESKKLKPGSEMQITTPIGSADIRGTIWRLTMQRVGGANSNQFRGNLDVSEGRVDFGSKDGSRSVQVRTGFSMNVQASTQPGGAVNYDSISTGRLSPQRAQLLVSSIKEVVQVQDVFSAVQGSPDVLLDVLQAMRGVDANNSQAVADAALTLLSGDAAQTQQVANVITALVVTQAEPVAAPRVVAEVVSSILTQSPNLASNVIDGVVATATMAAKNKTTNIALGQIITRSAVAAAAAAAPSQVSALTASGVTVATTRGSETVAPAISSAIVGAAITALPDQANLIAVSAVNAALASTARRPVVQNVIGALANSAAQNAAYAAISNGADRQAAEEAAAEVAKAVRDNTADTQFSDIVQASTDTPAVTQAVTQAQNNYDRGETPNTDGGSGTPGATQNNSGDAGGAKSDQPQPGADARLGATTNNQPQPTPRPTATPLPTSTPRPTPTPRPTATPAPTSTPRPTPPGVFSDI